ncbi:hypothetical protein IFT84_21290, partial [Rhizobium sp. CFBP 8762]|uniref:calcium-binding protein n=1 Tax=Rhizobium sp. CFBP 8762 TaxID=2775279 RepID=UPI00177B745E
GHGDDTLSGGDGDDVYRFEAGDGQDRITDASGIDRIEFGAGIMPDGTEVSLLGDASTLVVKFKNIDDRITIVNGAALDARVIEEFSFFDGTVWKLSDMARLWQRPTADADTIVGTVGDDT